MQVMEVRDLEIERLLDSYARACLAPDPQAVARARARVMREARLQFEASRIAVHLAPVASLSARRSTARRLMMPFLAASLWLGIAVGSMSAAQPGGPLFSTRMWIENAALPSGGVARASAELTRLDARLSDALGGASRGDVSAVQAALDAYRRIADETTAMAGGDTAVEALVSAALDRHLAVLAAVASSLEAKGNDTAAAAVEASIQRAIDHNEAVVQRIETNGAGNGENGGQPGVPGSGANGGPQGAPGSGGNGNGAGSGGSVNGGTGGNAGGSNRAGTRGRGKPDKIPKPTLVIPEHSPPAHSPSGQNK